MRRATYPSSGRLSDHRPTRSQDCPTASDRSGLPPLLVRPWMRERLVIPCRRKPCRPRRRCARDRRATLRTLPAHPRHLAERRRLGRGCAQAFPRRLRGRRRAAFPVDRHQGGTSTHLRLETACRLHAAVSQLQAPPLPGGRHAGRRGRNARANFSSPAARQ
jgi:hypothetical protein